MQQYTHKRGDTFIADCEYTDVDGNIVDLNTAGLTIRSSVRWNDKTFPLDVILLPEIGNYRIIGPTDNWPLGKVIWDVQFITADVPPIKRSSDSVIINVVQDATP